MKGNAQLNTSSSPFNSMDFFVNQKLLSVNTCELVKVVAVEGMFVDVVPMVLGTDGEGNAVDVGTIYHLPFLRVLGGENGIIINPKVNDIGLVCYCQRDISKVIASGVQSIPNTVRVLDSQDGIYVCTVASLNNAPTRFIEFTDSGIVITGNSSVTINGDVTVNGKITATGDVSGGGISLMNHIHGGVTTGSGNTGKAK